MFERYAIYYTPDPSAPLGTFGAAWLGWDSAIGATRPHPVVADLDVAAVTETPRKYGFHGTIKPPFRLVDGQSATALQDALAVFCANQAPVRLQGLELARLGRFLALVPNGSARDLGTLAAQAVQELDVFRAPPTAAELSKRRAAGLNPAQEAHLVRWGYPYVLDQFRFHLTLSGKLDKDTAAKAERALSDLLADITLTPYHIDSLTLLGEAPDGRFHHIHRYALTG